MPRHWRCSNGHAWTGDLGALTFCPDCGSADVYEVRPQYDSAAESPPPASAGPDAGQTFVQPAAVKAGTTAELRSAPATIGDTLSQPIFSSGAHNISDTLIQTPKFPSSAGDTFVQPALGGDTFIQHADPGTTQEHACIPPDDDGGTLVQAPALGNGPIADGGTLVQKPTPKDPSTLDMPIIGPYAATMDQPHGIAGDGPTMLAPQLPPMSNETRIYEGKPTDGASVPATPAETPTLDGSGSEIPAYQTADYPSTVSVHRGAGGRGAGLSGQDTKPSPPPSSRGKDARTAAPPPVEGYDILGVLGRGGMGVVYKARQIKLNRIVALKMILAGGHAGAYERQRFITEMNAVAHLQHPNIVQIYETGERDGLPYFTLEFCDGGSLQQKLGGQPMPPKVAADVVEQLSRAMQYAHERGIVHRDLKPANILFAGEEAAASKDKATPSKDSKLTTKDAKAQTKDSKVSRDASKDASQSKTSQSKAGQSFLSSRTGGSTGSVRTSRVLPKVTDFGLAKRLEEDSGLTGSGTILGTPSYMAPEQAAGQSRAVGPPADIHALGAILYEMLTGRPPFLGENVVETMNLVRTMDPVPPTHIQPKTPKDLETVCLKCLQKEMHKRYASAGDLAEDLRRFLDGEPIAARPVSTLEKGWKWAKRRPAQAALIAMSLVMLIGAAAGGLAFARIQGERADRERDHANEEARLKVRAEANLMSAREAVDKLLVRIGAEKLERVPKAQKLRKELLEQSLDFYDKFVKEQGDNPAIRREAGWAYQRVGRIRNDLGERKQAIAAYREAVNLFGPLAAEATDKQSDDQFDLARTHRQLAVALEADNRPTEADVEYESARDQLRQLADGKADRPAYRVDLADLLLNRGGQFYNRGKLAEAEDAFRQALAQYEILCREDATAANRFNRAKAQDNLGAVILVAGRFDMAITELEKAVSLLSASVKDTPDNPEYVKELGQAEFNLASAYFKAGKLDDARRTYQQSIARLTKLSKDFPDVEDLRFALAMAYDNYAVFLKTTAGLRAAEAERQHARTLFDELRRDFPENLDYRLRYALDVDEHAIFLAENDRLEEAISEEKIAVDLISGIAAAEPRNPDIGHIIREKARRILTLGQLYARNRQADEAEAEYALAAALLEGPANRRLRGDDSWYDLPVVYMNQAKLYEDQQRGKVVERTMRQAVVICQRIALASPDQPDAIAGLASAQFMLAGLSTTKPTEALALSREAVIRMQAALALAPKRPDLIVFMGKFGSKLIALYIDEGNHASAAAAAAALSRDVPQWLGLPSVAGQLVRCIRLARTDKTLSDEQKAKLSAAYGDQALDVLRKAVAAGYKNAMLLNESPELELLRTDPAFRNEFEKIIASIKK